MRMQDPVHPGSVLGSEVIEVHELSVTQAANKSQG